MNDSKDWKPRTTWADAMPAGQKEDEEWPEPQPLQIELRPVLPMRPEMLPESIRAWVVDAAYRMQVMLDFVAAPVVCVAGGLVGAGCSVRPKELDDWAVVPNLWGGLVGRPGTRKTSAINAAFKPVLQLEAEAGGAHKAKESKHAAECAALEAQRKAVVAELSKTAPKEKEKVAELIEDLMSLDKPEAPARLRYVTSDGTTEKLSELMVESPRGIFLLFDELMSLFARLDRDDRREDRAYHLKAWAGDTAHTTDRIGRGTIENPQLCESIFGGIQPSKLLGYLALTKGNIANDGLVQRLQLLVYPDALDGEPVLVDRRPDSKAGDRAFAAIKKLSKMDFTAHGAEIDEYAKIPFIHFDQEAQQLFNRWYLGVEGKRRSEGEDVMVEHLSKFDSLMPSVALVFHLLEVAASPEESDPPQKISLRNAELAIEWCTYLESHARRIYGLAANMSVQAARKLLEKIRDGVIQEGFTARDVYMQNWSFLDSKKLAQAGIEELVETGWLREIPPPGPQPKGGRPFTPSFRIHPRAHDILGKQ